jgi:hypothetical protein
MTCNDKNEMCAHLLGKGGCKKGLHGVWEIL